jgi:hypothetical protein
MAQPVTLTNLNDLIDGITQGAAQTIKTLPDDSLSKFVQLASVITPGTTTARNAAASTGVVYNNLLSKVSTATFICKLTAAATEAGDTLDVFVDLSLDTVTWFNGIHFTQMLGNGGAKTFVASICFPTAGVANIDVTSDAAAAATRNLWAPHVRIGWNNTDANANTNAIFSFSVSAYLQGY